MFKLKYRFFFNYLKSKQQQTQYRKSYDFRRNECFFLRLKHTVNYQKKRSRVEREKKEIRAKRDRIANRKAEEIRMVIQKMLKKGTLTITCKLRRNKAYIREIEIYKYI